MAKKSREKGKRGEREAAKALSNELGIPIKRGVQYQGSFDSPDLTGLSAHGLHPEVKRDESTISKALYKAIEQALLDSGKNVPFVMSRRNNYEWLIVLKLEDLVKFCKKINEIKN